MSRQRPITPAGANRRLLQLTKPVDKSAAEFKVGLALVGESPDFGCARFVHDVCVNVAWNGDCFGSSRADQLRDLVVRAISSGVVDFSDEAVDGAFADVLPEILLSEPGGKSETARLFDALIRCAPKKSAAWTMAMRLNAAFGLTLAGFSI